ncbi:MAG: hypothetical protein ACPG3Z_07345 [Saprospiraceae bacterium]
MIEDLQSKFIAALERQYGTWEKETARFGSASYGKISKDLCISASQFTKLIYGNATDGMYIRSIKNVGRLTAAQQITSERDTAISERDKIQSKLEAAQEQSNRLQVKWQKSRKKIVLLPILSLLLGIIGMSIYHHYFKNKSSEIIEHPLSPYFDKGFDAYFDTPYLNETEVQDYCPCSAYEGEWSLDKPFKLPLPGSRQPGLYYLAKSSDLRMKCSKIGETSVGKGNVLAGYEYLISEIWVDIKQTPIIPKYFDDKAIQFTTEFEELNFEDNPQFKKIATLHAFNVNHFEIHPDSIVRRAELTGRYATEVDESLALQYQIDIKHILQNVLGNLTKTDCESTPNPYCSPNDLKEKESVIAFDCLYTIKTENLGFGGGYPYTKGFRLEKQSYSDHLTCECTAD